MALITVNELPSIGSVVREDNHVYHWYQTTVLVAPFTPITPIDHGYYALSYEGPQGDGFLPQPSADGWLRLTGDPRELPVEFLESVDKIGSVVSIDTTIYVAKLGTASPTMVDIGEVRATKLSSPIGIDLVAQYPLVFSDVPGFSILNRERALVCYNNHVSVDVSLSKNLASVIPSLVDITKTKTIKTTTVVSLPILNRELTCRYAAEVALDISKISKLFSQPTNIDVTLAKSYYTTLPSSISLNLVERSIVAYNDVTAIDLTAVNKFFANMVEIPIPSSSKGLNYAVPTRVDTTLGRHLVAADHANSADIELFTRELEFTDSPIKVPIGVERLVKMGGTSSMDIKASSLAVYFSSTCSSDVNAKSLDVRFSSTTNLDIVYSHLDTFGTIYSSVASVLVNLSSKELEFSSPNSVDIAYTGQVRVIEDENWILLKRFGTRGWKFLSFLDYFDKTEIKHNLAIDFTVASNYLGILGISQAVEVTYDALNGDRVSQVTRYSDDTQQFIAEDIKIYYDAYNMPVTMIVDLYTPTGQLYKRYTESFANTGYPNYEMYSSNFVVDNLGFVPYDITGPVELEAQPGDALYLDGTIYRRAIASSITTSRVVGFLASVTDYSNAAIRTRDNLPVFSGLLPGVTYFLSRTTPGGITSTPPSLSGSVAQKVGIASSTTELVVNLQNQLVIRS